MTIRRSERDYRQMDDLDPRYWGPTPTRWQLFTARLWQCWLRLRKKNA